MHGAEGECFTFGAEGIPLPKAKLLLGHVPLAQIEDAPAVVDKMAPNERSVWLDHSRVATSAPVVAVSCGAAHTALVLTTGTLCTFGQNGSGQLGYRPSALSMVMRAYNLYVNISRAWFLNGR